jgi:hypothetical protein
MTHTDVDRRSTIADYAVPTPRSPNGLYIDLRLSLYNTDGHSAFGPIKGERHAVLNCADDLELIAELAKLIGKLRRQQKRRD